MGFWHSWIRVKSFLPSCEYSPRAISILSGDGSKNTPSCVVWSELWVSFMMWIPKGRRQRIRFQWAHGSPEPPSHLQEIFFFFRSSWIWGFDHLRFVEISWWYCQKAWTKEKQCVSILLMNYGIRELVPALSFPVISADEESESRWLAATYADNRTRIQFSWLLLPSQSTNILK